MHSMCLASILIYLFDAVSMAKLAECLVRLPREKNKEKNDENAKENCRHESFDMVWACCCCSFYFYVRVMFEQSQSQYLPTCYYIEKCFAVVHDV